MKRRPERFVPTHWGRSAPQRPRDSNQARLMNRSWQSKISVAAASFRKDAQEPRDTPVAAPRRRRPAPTMRRRGEVSFAPCHAVAPRGTRAPRRSGTTRGPWRGRYEEAQLSPPPQTSPLRIQGACVCPRPQPRVGDLAPGGRVVANKTPALHSLTAKRFHSSAQGRAVYVEWTWVTL